MPYAKFSSPSIHWSLYLTNTYNHNRFMHSWKHIKKVSQSQLFISHKHESKKETRGKWGSLQIRKQYVNYHVISSYSSEHQDLLPLQLLAWVNYLSKLLWFKKPAKNRINWYSQHSLLWSWYIQQSNSY